MTNRTDIVCLSHLRWGFVFQRPNHLMSRAAQSRRVFFFEEPIIEHGETRLEVREAAPDLWVCTPHLDASLDRALEEATQRALLEGLLRERGVEQPILWFYTPMALPLTAGIDASLVVYDCMDELSHFRGAPPELTQRESQLFAVADLVFTGGQSLYEAKRARHPRVHAFPSSVDAHHFARARAALPEPADQRDIPRPRIGFFGVVDERMDLDLLEEVAKQRPNYQFIVIGPVVKIAESALPRLPNLHYLGGKSYEELPLYLSGWDAAMMPFALNEATRFISPTKTLEYLAAGKPVVSTAIRDVVSPYGEEGVVRIADRSSFATAVDAALATPSRTFFPLCDAVMARTSWDRTWSEMLERIEGALERRSNPIRPMEETANV